MENTGCMLYLYITVCHHDNVREIQSRFKVYVSHAPLFWFITFFYALVTYVTAGLCRQCNDSRQVTLYTQWFTFMTSITIGNHVQPYTTIYNHIQYTIIKKNKNIVLFLLEITADVKYLVKSLVILQKNKKIKKG